MRARKKLQQPMKVMAIAGMVVAQLLFDKDDRIWHLLSEGWQPGGEQKLRRPPKERVWLVPVPVLRSTDDAAIQLALGNLDGPAEAIRWPWPEAASIWEPVRPSS